MAAQMGASAAAARAHEELYAYWARLREGGRLPGRDDIRPDDFKRLLPTISLIDVQREPMDFRLRLAGALGFAPSLDVCGQCGCELNGPGQFVVDEGHVRCPSCRAEAGPVRYGVELSADGLDLLRHVQQELPSAWHAEELPPADRRACSRVIDGFVQYHLGLAWEGGFFRRV